MAFGFGPGSDMVKSVQSNRKQLSKKRTYKETHDRYKDVADKETPNFKKVSAEELAAYKSEFLKKKKKEDMHNTIIVVSVAVIVLLGFYFLMFT